MFLHVQQKYERKKERKIIIFLSTFESESENIDIDSLVEYELYY